MKIQKPKSYKSRVILIAIALLLVLGAILVALYFKRSDESIKRDAGGVSVERTVQDKRLEDALNENPEGKNRQTQTDVPARPEVDEQSQLQKANVVLTSVRQQIDQVSASGFVSNIVEDEGQCTYIFNKGTATVKKTSGTLTNSSSTTCKTVEFHKSELSVGIWNVHIEYLSSISSGTSNDLELNVQ